MAVVLWVMGFLLVFSTATYYRYENFQLTQSRFKIFLGKEASLRGAQVEACRLAVAIEKEKTKGSQTENKHEVPQSEEEEEDDDDETPTYLYLDFPPHNARLNLKKLFKEYSEVRTTQQEATYAHIFMRLLDNLYAHLPYFQKNKNASFIIFSKLMELASMDKKEGKVLLTISTDLASIDFHDPELQETWYHLLKGSKNKQGDTLKGGYPSLLDFVFMEKKRQKFSINIHHAPKELLAALFDHQKVADAIVLRREILHHLGKKKTKSKKAFNVTELYLKEEDVKEIVEAHHLDYALYKSEIDCKVPDQSSLRANLANDFSITVQDQKTGFLAQQTLPEVKIDKS